MIRFVIVEDSIADPIADPIGGKRCRRLERITFSALSAGNEVYDVTSGVQARRPTIRETLTNAALAHGGGGVVVVVVFLVVVFVLGKALVKLSHISFVLFISVGDVVVAVVVAAMSTERLVSIPKDLTRKLFIVFYGIII